MDTMKESKVSKENEIDRLSDLPDSLIHHILSSMNTKYAVQTSVLSKRWKRLWTSIPTLNFDCDSFNSLISFKKFVLSVLSRREPVNLHSLKFRTRSLDTTLIAKVVSYAAWHSVPEIHIDDTINRADGFLSIMSLRSWFLSITSLRTLFIENCSLCGDHFASCVHLENLTINRCFISWKDVKISAPRLVTVNMTSVTRSVYHELEPDAYTLKVSSPRLSSFSYQGTCPSMFSMDGCPLLDSVDFRVHLERQMVLPFPILQELILHAKLPTIELKQGFTVKSISRNDDGMHAVFYNEANKKRRKLFWQETDENSELLLLWTLERFEN